jgi:hypothetical protein
MNPFIKILATSVALTILTGCVTPYSGPRGSDTPMGELPAYGQKQEKVVGQVGGMIDEHPYADGNVTIGFRLTPQQEYPQVQYCRISVKQPGQSHWTIIPEIRGGGRLRGSRLQGNCIVDPNPHNPFVFYTDEDGQQHQIRLQATKGTSGDCRAFFYPQASFSLDNMVIIRAGGRQMNRPQRDRICSISVLPPIRRGR